MLEKILNRWKFLLDQFEAEPKAILAKELLKIMPSKDNFTVDWRINSIYDEETNIYHFNYMIYLSPIHTVEEGDPVDLYDFFVRVISNTTAEDLAHLDRSLKSIPTKIVAPYHLKPSIIPCMVLTSEVGIVVFRVQNNYLEQTKSKKQISYEKKEKREDRKKAKKD